MLVGLSPDTGPPTNFKSVAISSTCLNLSTLFGSNKRCQRQRPISLTIRRVSHSPF